MTTKAVADQVGVRGFVVNLKDGSVYIEGEGDDFALDSLLEFCQEGPEGAIVESVEVKWNTFRAHPLNPANRKQGHRGQGCSIRSLRVGSRGAAAEHG